MVNIAITKAKSQLTELVRRAEAGEEIVLTRRGQPAVRLSPANSWAGVRSPAEQLSLLQAIHALQEEAAAAMVPGPDAAHAADFLFDDETGLPA